MNNRHQHVDLLPSFPPIRAFAAREKNRVLWVWVLCVLALLYNPISRVHLDRRELVRGRSDHHRCCGFLAAESEL
jgi:hypothetical protein